MFLINDKGKGKIVELNPAFRNYNERSENVDRVLRQFREDDVFVTLKGWRDEVSIVDMHFVHYAMWILLKFRIGCQMALD